MKTYFCAGLLFLLTALGIQAQTIQEIDAEIILGE